MYENWVKRGIEKPGKSAIGLARALKEGMNNNRVYNRSLVYKLITGLRKFQVDELNIIAKYIEEPIPLLENPIGQNGGLIKLPSSREIGAGTWVEGDQVGTGHRVTIVPKDHQFPNAEHLAYTFKGDSMNAIGILDGDTIVCVSFKDAATPLADGMKVVIERERAGLHELSLRVVSIKKDSIEFSVASTNPVFKPVTAYRKGKHLHAMDDNEKITVVAILRLVTRNV